MCIVWSEESEGIGHIYNFWFYVKLGKQVPQETMEFIADAFAEIWNDGANPEEALRLVRMTGPKIAQYRNSGRDIAIATQVELVRSICGDKNEAVDIVADMVCKSDKRVKAICGDRHAEAIGVINTLRDQAHLVCAIKVQNALNAGCDIAEAIAAVANEYSIKADVVGQCYDGFVKDAQVEE